MIGGTKRTKAEIGQEFYTMASKRREIVTKIIDDNIPAEDVITLVDMGCGQGEFLKHMLNGSKVERLVGVDMDKGCLEFVKDTLCQITNYDVRRFEESHKWFHKTHK